LALAPTKPWTLSFALPASATALAAIWLEWLTWRPISEI
jgi:hypothetical protein